MSRLLLVFVAVFLASCVSVKPSDKTWSAQAYKNNSGSQSTAADHALQRVTFHKDEDVLDVGCGDGKITAKIAQKITHGNVVGIDLSQAMVDFAKKNFRSYANLSFEQMNADNISYNNQFDTVVSFSAMQWVSNQQQALVAIANALKPNGRFLMMIPAGYPEPLQKALDDMMSHETWRKFFVGFKPGQVFYNKKQYESMLKKAGFKNMVVEVVPSFDNFKNETLFSNFVRQWLPHLTPIPKEQHDAFMAALMTRYLKHQPAEADKSVWFKKYSLEALASKI